MKTIDTQLIDALTQRAGALPRRRANHNVHETPADPIQRLFVAAMRDSYFRPHRHPTKWEFVVVIRGHFDIIVFDDAGSVTERLSVGPGSKMLGCEFPANTWHASVPMAEDSVFLEVKPGPYDARTVSEFAGWSPPEGAPGISRYLDTLRQAKVGESVALGRG